MSGRLGPLLVLLFATGLAGCGDGWKDYVSTEGGFQARMPGTVKTESRTLLTPAGQALPISSYSVEQKKGDGEVVFSVLVYGEAKEPIQDLSAEVPKMAREMGGSILSQKECEVDGAKGVQLEIQLAKEKDGRAALRMFIHEGRLYQLVVVGPNARAEADDVQKFWDSFRLLRP